MHCGFTIDHYLECLLLAKDKGYSIKRVCDYNKKDKKVILLRHDIDFSLEYAYELANIEYDLGICSSYYVYLHAETYNALSPKGMGMIKAMKGMGHEIGLHADGDSYLSIAEEDVLEDIVGPLASYSSHNPGLTKKIGIPYLLNPNDLKLKYISDSGRNWREGCMCNWIGKEDKLHILVHPVWWITNTANRDLAIVALHEDLMIKTDNAINEIKILLEDYKKEVGIK